MPLESVAHHPMKAQICTKQTRRTGFGRLMTEDTIFFTIWPIRLCTIVTVQALLYRSKYSPLPILEILHATGLDLCPEETRIVVHFKGVRIGFCEVTHQQVHTTERISTARLRIHILRNWEPPMNCRIGQLPRFKKPGSHQSRPNAISHSRQGLTYAEPDNVASMNHPTVPCIRFLGSTGVNGGCFTITHQIIP